MKRILPFIFILLCFISSAFSQTDFKKGYIVKPNGDTLNGYINFRKEAENNVECNFKRFQIAFPVNYTPEKIKAYGISGEKQYLSARLNGKIVFAEYLVKGNLSLLYFKKGAQHFYIRDSKGKIVELEPGKTNDPASNQTFDHYKEYLSDKMKAVPVNDQIQDSKLEINSLTLLVKRYNELSNYPFDVPQRPAEKSVLKDYSILRTKEIKFGILSGIALDKFKCYASGPYGYLDKTNFNPVTNPIFGLFVRNNISRYSPHFQLQSAILFQKVSLYGFSTYNTNSYSKDVTYNDVYIDYKSISIRETVDYALIMNRIKILPHIGFGYTLIYGRYLL